MEKYRQEWMGFGEGARVALGGSRQNKPLDEDGGVK